MLLMCLMLKIILCPTFHALRAQKIWDPNSTTPLHPLIELVVNICHVRTTIWKAAEL